MPEEEWRARRVKERLAQEWGNDAEQELLLLKEHLPYLLWSAERAQRKRDMISTPKGGYEMELPEWPKLKNSEPS